MVLGWIVSGVIVLITSSCAVLGWWMLRERKMKKKIELELNPKPQTTPDTIRELSTPIIGLKACLICSKLSTGDVCGQACLDEWYKRNPAAKR